MKATSKETILEGPSYAVEAIVIKSDAVNVWVLRDKAILPVDLPAICKGEAKTNYALKPCDQLLEQAKQSL